MNISKYEQRTLHALAPRIGEDRSAQHQDSPRRIRASEGGVIHHIKNDKGDIVEIDCLDRDGWRLDDCALQIFRKLRRRVLIMSREGGPYRITRDGLAAVRAQLDNR